MSDRTPEQARDSPVVIGIVSSCLPAIEKGTIRAELAFSRNRRRNLEEVACRAKEFVGEVENLAA